MKENLVLMYADIILLDKNIKQPFEKDLINGADIRTFNPESGMDFMAAYDEACKKGRTVIVTGSKKIKNIAVEFFDEYTDRYKNTPAVYCDGTWYAEKALEEVQKLDSVLMDETGKEKFIIDTPLFDDANLFASDSGRIMLRTDHTSVKNAKCLYHQSPRKGKEKWGILLPKEYSAVSYKGKLGSTAFSESTVILMLHGIVSNLVSSKKGGVPENDSIYVFNDHDCLITGWNESITSDADVSSFFDDLVFRSFFGVPLKGQDDIMYVMIEKLRDMSLPGFIVDFIESVFCCGKKTSPELWENIFARYLMESTEDK